jgi:hypothetical protein
MMWLRTLFKTSHGAVFVAALVGFGLATMLRKSCTDLSCREFIAPPIDEIELKKVKNKGACYRFEPSQMECVDGLKTVEMR